MKTIPSYMSNTIAIAFASILSVIGFSDTGVYVNEIYTPDHANDYQQIIIGIDGTLPNSCYSIESVEIVQVEYDIFIMLDENAGEPNSVCMRELQRFYREVTIPPLTPNTYTVHVKDLMTSFTVY